MDKISVGLASFGMSGMVFHAPFLANNPGFRLSKILERTPKGAKEIYPETVIVKDFNELLEDKDIELIVVNTPDHTHLDLTRKALLADKHVLVEKPLTITVEEGLELAKLAEKKNRVLTVYQNRRWDGDFLTVKKILSEGLIGDLVEYESHYDRFRNFIQQNTWKEAPDQGTGNIYNLGSHLIDQALVLFGMPHSVFADLEIRREGSLVNDYFHIHLYYEGMTAILKSSYLVREPGPRYILHGDKGSFVKYGNDPQEELLKSGAIPVGEDWGREEEEFWGLLNTEMNGETVRYKLETIPGNYHAFYDNLYQAIRSGKDLAVKPQEAIDIIRIIEAAQKSNKLKKVVIFDG
jgi:predicted dehydrogenase